MCKKEEEKDFIPVQITLNLLLLGGENNQIFSDVPTFTTCFNNFSAGEAKSLM